MHRTSLTIVVTFAGILLLFGSNVNATEAYKLKAPSMIKLNYDPFTGLPSSHTFFVKLKKTNGASNSNRPYSIRIRPSDLGDFDAKGEVQDLPVNFRSIGARELRKIGNEYYQDLRVGTLYEDNMELEYEVSIPESVFAKPGAYQLPLDIDLIDSNTKEVLDKSRSARLRVSVKPKVQTNIAGTRASYEDGATFSVVDFGQLESGESERIFVQVRGNAMARLKIQSDNRGKMIHQSIPDLHVDYSIKIDGRHSDLNAPLVLSKSLAQDLQGSSYPMEIIVGDVSKSYAGNYHDVITISVRPQ